MDIIIALVVALAVSLGVAACIESIGSDDDD